MAYATKYILGFNNDLDELYEIYFDYLGYVGESSNIIGTDNCLTLRCTNADDDKTAPILGTECLIEIAIFDATSLSIYDLIAQYDNQIRITVYKDQNYGSFIFQGFVVVEDNSQPFMDPPYVVSLRALDLMGLLKDIPLTDTNGLPITQPLSILQWIVQCLYFTGQTANIKIYFNFYNASFLPTLSSLFETWLNGVTFQSSSANFSDLNPADVKSRLGVDDCYTALEKIIRCLRCRIFIEDGCWHVVSLYEYLSPLGSTYFEYSIGAPVDGIASFTKIGSGQNIDYSIKIGRDQIVHAVQNDALLYLKLATKWIELQYSYDQALNKICNQDLTQGTTPGLDNPAYAEMINSQIIDPTGGYNIGHTSSGNPIFFPMKTLGWDLYCWTHFNSFSSAISELQFFPNQAPDKKTFTRVVYDVNGFEVERFLVLEITSVLTYVQSSEFLLDEGDLIEVSFDMRLRSDQVVGTFLVGALLMEGDDGTFWAYRAIEGDSTAIAGVAAQKANAGTWVQCDANYNQLVGTLFTPSISWIFSSGASPLIIWTNITAGAVSFAPSPAPISGTLRLYLGGYIFGPVSNPASPVQEIWFKNIQVTISPFISGSFVQVKGDYNYVGSNNNILQTSTEVVEISDSPKRYFKGALLNQDGDGVSPPTWHRVGFVESYRFQQIMGIILYNHIGRMLQKIEGTMRGLVYLEKGNIIVVHPNGFLNRYYFIDGPNPTKAFMLTSFEKNLCTGQWRGVFVECLADANDNGWTIPPVYVFNYLFQT